MKTCEKCNLPYDDDKKFCKKCGGSLSLAYQIEPKEVAKKNVFEDRLKSDPLNIDILHEYAQFLFNNLLFREANAVLLKILAIKGNDGSAKELLYKSYFKLNMLKEADEIGKQLLSDNPNNILLLENLAEISKTLGDAEGAAVLFNKILSLQPSHPDALLNKAMYLLAKNQFEIAIEIFSKLYKQGQNSRITTIYVGIESALKADYQSAIKLLNPVLTDDKPDHDDINLNRGVLYYIHSLCKSSAELAEIEKWASRLDIKILKNNHHPFDEQKFVEIADFVVKQNLLKVKSLKYAKDQLLELTQSYLGNEYFTANSNSKIAEIWYAVGNKQVEMKLFDDALISFQKASNLNPSEAKFKKKIDETDKILSRMQKKERRIIFLLLGTLTVITILIIELIIVYRNSAENKVWELALQTNTQESVQGYLNSYPKGKYLKEAGLYLEKYVIKDIDGNVYNKVKIGSQVWMIENLLTTKLNDGSSIPNITDESAWANLSTPGYCWYKNDIGNKKAYGALYNWYAVNTGKLCPTGWHVPTDAEWKVLEIYLGMSQQDANNEGVRGSIDKAFKFTSGWRDNENGDNSSGFAALPGGGSYGGVFDGLGNDAYFWSSSESDASNAWYRILYYDDAGVNRLFNHRGNGFSARCLQN